MPHILKLLLFLLWTKIYLLEIMMFHVWKSLKSVLNRDLRLRKLGMALMVCRNMKFNLNIGAL